jgi:ribosomal protein S18 acetylase RimI-like enzyme
LSMLIPRSHLTVMISRRHISSPWILQTNKPPNQLEINAMQTVIRPLSTSDYESVKDIFYNTFKEPEYADKNCEDSWRDRSVPDSLGIFSTKGALLGFAIVSFHTRNGPNRYLDYLAVHSAYRGQDLGSKLLGHILKICEDLGTSIHLYPVKSERVRAWYRSQGFRDTAGGYMNLHFYNTRLSSKERDKKDT